MRHHSPIISQHRLQRLHRWAMLWLTWFSGFLEAAADFAPITQAVETLGHLWLDKIERLIVSIVILRAAPHVRRLTPRKGVSPHRRKESGLFRAIIGARVRRALRSRNLHQRIAALRQDLGELVAQVLRRLPCGLTRRRPMLARRSNWTAGARAGICPHTLKQAGAGAGAPIADTS